MIGDVNMILTELIDKYEQVNKNNRIKKVKDLEEEIIDLYKEVVNGLSDGNIVIYCESTLSPDIYVSKKYFKCTTATFSGYWIYLNKFGIKRLKRKVNKIEKNRK